MSVQVMEPYQDNASDLAVQELTHRFFNSLQIIDTLLSRLTREATAEAAGRTVAALRTRVRALSELHRKLAADSGSRDSLEDYCRSLCWDVVQTFGRIGVTCCVAIADVRLDPDRELRVVLLVVELVTNALKHSWRDGEITIWVDLAAPTMDTLELWVRDNGAVSRPLATPPRLASALARSLGGGLRTSGSQGFCACAAFPANAPLDVATEGAPPPSSATFSTATHQE